jgi:hypothetical protein
MCPFCFATVGLVVVGAVSTGGLAALAAKISHTKNNAEAVMPNSNQGSNSVNPNR